MPLAGGEVEDRAAGAHVYGGGEAAGVVIEVFFEVAPDAHDGHRAVGVPVYGQLCAGYNAPQISDSKLNQKKYNFAV